MKNNSIAFKFPGSFEEQRFEKLHNVVCNLHSQDQRK